MTKKMSTFAMSSPTLRQEARRIGFDLLQGLDLVFNGTETKKIVLSGADDEVNVVSGGKLAAGPSTSGGNDVIRLQSGAEVNGGIQAGTGDDSLYIQKDVVLTVKSPWATATTRSPSRAERKSPATSPSGRGQHPDRPEGRLDDRNDHLRERLHQYRGCQRRGDGFLRRRCDPNTTPSRSAAIRSTAAASVTGRRLTTTATVLDELDVSWFVT
jgi:hypothetical protein